MRLLRGCEGPDHEKPTLTQPWQDRMALGPPGSGDLPCLSLDGVALPQIELAHKFGVYLDLHLFLYEEGIAMAGVGGGLCTDSSCELIVSFPGLEDLAHSHSCMGYFPFGILQCVLQQAILEDHLEIIIGPVWIGACSIGHP